MCLYWIEICCQLGLICNMYIIYSIWLIYHPLSPALCCLPSATHDTWLVLEYSKLSKISGFWYFIGKMTQYNIAWVLWQPFICSYPDKVPLIMCHIHWPWIEKSNVFLTSNIFRASFWSVCSHVLMIHTLQPTPWTGSVQGLDVMKVLECSI